MGYITVKFLGDEYQVSESINTFLNYDKLLAQITKKLMDAEMQSIKKYSRYKPSEFMELAQQETEKYRQLVNEIANSLVKDLLSRNIYDVTKNDLLKDMTIFSTNEEYVGEYERFVLKTQLEAKLKYIDYIEYEQTGIANAYMNAASNITGSGVTVFSSSFSTLMAHAIVERGILSSQAKQADKEYQAAVQSITSHTDNMYEQYCKDTMLNVYFPTLTNMLTEFANTTMSEFLTQLTLHNQFDFDSMQKYNMQKADDMLKNINQVPDKIAFLKQAFLTCPFCVDVYEKCIDMGVMDTETFETAENFGFANAFTDRLEKQCQKNVNNKDKFNQLLKLYVRAKGCSTEGAFHFIFDSKINDIYKQYKTLLSAPTNNNGLDKWIRDNINRTTSKLINRSKDDIDDILSKKVNSIISERTYNSLVDIGLLLPQSIRIDGSSAIDLATINKEIIDLLSSSIMNYIAEAKKRKNAYEDAKTQYNQHFKKLDSELMQLEEQKSNLGLFSFSKRKELSTLVNSKKFELQELKRKSPVEGLLKKFNDMYS